jgi:hypothetical protein
VLQILRRALKISGRCFRSQPEPHELEIGLMMIQKTPAILWEFSVGMSEYVLRCTSTENSQETFTVVVTENGEEVLREVITMGSDGEAWRIPYQYAFELRNHFRARAIERRS